MSLCIFPLFSFQVGCRVPHVPLRVHQVPQALQDLHLLAKASPLLYLVPQIVVTDHLLLFSSRVNLASPPWDPCHQVLHLQVMVLLLVPHHPNKAHHLQDPFLPDPQAQLVPRWLWHPLHTCQVPLLEDHHQHPMSTLHSSPHLAATTCHPTTEEAPLDQTTHTGAHHRMKEGTMVLEAGKRIKNNMAKCVVLQRGIFWEASTLFISRFVAFYISIVCSKSSTHCFSSSISAFALLCVGIWRRHGLPWVKQSLRRSWTEIEPSPPAPSPEQCLTLVQVTHNDQWYTPDSGARSCGVYSENTTCPFKINATLVFSSADYGSAIETLVTAISLIKQSKVSADDRCKVLISSLQDCLHGIESKSYGSASR